MELQKPEEDLIPPLIQAIHATPEKLVLVIAGAGHGALRHLLDVAGASRSVLEALVPYSRAAFTDFLTATPAQFVASETARLLAGRAYTRARQLQQDDSPFFGVACTATIATDRPKQGDHRAHIASWQRDGIVEYELQLEKGARRRQAEEALVSMVLLNTIAESAGLPTRLPLALLKGDTLSVQRHAFQPAAQALVAGDQHAFGIQADGLPYPAAVPPVLLPGSFNPLHEGHLGMAEAAAQLLQQPVAFELAAINVDKPPLPAALILDRIGQFAGRFPVLVTDAPTYIQKARLFPGTTFVIGYDTAVRLFAPRYYNNSETEMLAALTEIQSLGCHFLVAGRLDKAGVFRSLADVAIPPQFSGLFCAIPETLFRSDISSTALRKAGAQGSR